MGLLSIFKNPSRDLLPLMYYAKNEPMGNMVSEKEFSRALADNIILFCQRLHEMGVFEEDRIVCFDIDGMLDMLSQWGALDGVRINSFDRAQVVFGKKYAGHWYENQESQPYIQYMVPEQIVFYHSKKEDNYYLSAIGDGLDLTTNKVSVSNLEDNRKLIGKGSAVKLREKEAEELRTSFHILFSYLKYKILINADKLGYNAFVEKFVKCFCSSQSAIVHTDYAKQFFSLNTEKKEIYPLAYRDFTFDVFFEHVTRIYDMGIFAGSASLKKYAKWLRDTYSILMDDRAYDNSFDLLSAANVELEKKGKAIYFWRFSENFSEDKILIGEKDMDLSNKIGIKIIPFGADLKAQYAERIADERKVREVARAFYKAIGVQNVEELMRNIHGFEVLDGALYDPSYALNIDWKGEDLSYILEEFFTTHGMKDLVEALSINGKTIDEQRFGDDDEVSPYDRVVLYAEEIRHRGKLLVHLDTNSDAYDFVLIDHDEKSKRRFAEVADRVIALGEFSSYRILE